MLLHSYVECIVRASLRGEGHPIFSPMIFSPMIFVSYQAALTNKPLNCMLLVGFQLTDPTPASFITTSSLAVYVNPVHRDYEEER